MNINKNKELKTVNRAFGKYVNLPLVTKRQK